MPARDATTEDLRTKYHKVYYKATDGSYYPMKDYYPIVLEVANRPDCVYLDTGGEMASCDFFVAKIENGKLLRELLPSRKFKTISPKVVVKGEI